MKIEHFKPFVGQHCESTTTGTLLRQLDIELSEPMLFGLGEGLSFIFWNMKSMNFPFIGGRVKPDVLTEHICRNLNLNLEVKETSSITKAWANVRNEIDNNRAVGVKLDCYHLDYFSTKIHFAGHYVAMYGYDNAAVYLIDTEQQGGSVKASLQNFELARNEKGPMSSRNRSFTISKKEKLSDLKSAVKYAISNNSREYLNPPINNISYKGIQKAATEIKKWFATSEDIKSDFQTTAVLMERAGTGGSLFRNLYRDFLKESYELLKIKAIKEAYVDFEEIAKRWKNVSDLFHKAGETLDEKYINQASEILLDLGVRERTAMEKLNTSVW